jgi:signal transduction histidine kinase
MIRFTVRRRIVVLLVLVSLVPLAVANGIWLLSSQATLRGAAANQQELLVKSSADAVSYFIDGKVNAAIIHSQSVAVQSMRLPEAETELSAYMQQDSDLSQVTLVDAGGVQRLAVTSGGVSTTPQNVASSAAFRVVTFLGGEEYISPVSIDAQHEGHITISVPLVKYSGTEDGSYLSTSEPGVILPPSAIRGALVVQVALKHLWDSVLANRQGQTGYAYVVDDQGNLIAYPQASYAASHPSLPDVAEVRTALAEPPPLPGAQVPAPTSHETISETGTKVLSSHYRVARTGWVVVVEDPIRSVYAPVDNDVRVAAIFFVLSALVGLALILLTARSLLAPIRALTEGATMLARGNLGFRIAMSRRDEFGLLAHTFNVMAAKISADIAKFQDADGLKNEFIFIASHNLRTPVTLIKGYAELMKSSPVSAETLDLLTGIERGAQELSRFSEEMLTISTIESGYTTLDIATIPVGELLKPVRTEYESVAAAKGITLAWSEPEPTTLVRLSPVHIRTVLSNILRNAMEFTSRGGRVEAEVAVTPQSYVIRVRDTGSGIDPIEVKRLFTKFHRGTSALRYDHPGTGIGLYVTGLIVEAHHGQIAVRSQVGHGTSFTITLPAKRTDDETAA